MRYCENPVLQFSVQRIQKTLLKYAPTLFYDVLNTHDTMKIKEKLTYLSFQNILVAFLKSPTYPATIIRLMKFSLAFTLKSSVGPGEQQRKPPKECCML